MKLLKLFITTLMLPIMMFASIGKIAAMNGDVSIVRDTKTIKAKAGSELEKSDVVKSSVGSVAQLVFNDKTIITVGSNTVLSIKEYIYDDKTPSAKFGVEKGYFKTVTGQIGKAAPDKFKLETKTATLGIRGTEFKGFVDEEGNLFTLTTKGKTIVTSNIPNIPSSSAEVPAGYMTKATTKGVEPSKPFDINELKKLNEGLGGYAKNNTKQQSTKNDDSVVASDGTKEQTPQTKIASNVNNLTGEVVNQVNNLSSVAPKWADAYGVDYVPGTTYNAVGNSVVFSNMSGSIYYGGGNSNFTLSPFDGLANGRTASYTISGEDSILCNLSGSLDFPMGSTTTTITTISDKADYSSWGYWTTTYSSPSTKDFGVWISGAKTAQSEINTLLTNGGSATYKGQAIGGVISASNSYDAIKLDSNNVTTLNINFGATSAINGSINFQTENNKQWNIVINNNSVAINSSSAKFAIGSGITGTVDNGAGPSGLTGGSIEGIFHGPNATILGGSFGANHGVESAHGVFKATKQ